MLLSEIVYNIQNLISGGVQSDDNSLSDQQIAFIINYYRVKLFKNDQEKAKLNKDLYIQNLGQVDLIKADKNECCSIGTGSCILRTENKVPTPIESINGINITYVGLTNGEPFNYLSNNSLKWKHGAKYVGKLPSYYFQNGYIYLIDPPTKDIKHINIQGVFENPQEAIKFRTCDCISNNEDCFDDSDYDFEYKIPAQHIDTIVKLFMEAEYKLLRLLPQDTSNDTISQLGDAQSPLKR